MNISRIIKKMAIISVTAVAFFIVVVFALFQTNYVRQKIVGYVAARLQEETGWNIEIAEIKGLFPWQIEAREVKATSPQADALNIDILHLMVSFWDLLKGELAFPFAALHEVSWNSQANPSPFPSFHMKGKVSFAEGVFKGDVHVWQPGPNRHSPTAVSWEIHQGLKEVEVKAIIKEEAQGVIATALKIENLAPLELHCRVIGSKETWQQQLQATKENERLEPLFIEVQGYSNSKSLFETFFTLQHQGHLLHFEEVKGKCEMAGCLLPFTGKGHFDMAEKEGKAQFKIALEELQIPHFPIQGEGQLLCTLSSERGKQQLSLELISSRLSFAEQELYNVVLQAEGFLLDGKVEGKASSSFERETLPIAASTYFALTGWEKEEPLLQLFDAKIALPNSSTATLHELKIFLKEKRLEGEIEAVLENSMPLKLSLATQYGQPSSCPYQLTWHSSSSIECRAESSGYWHLIPGGLAIDIDALQGTVANEPFFLQQPSRLMLSSPSAELSTLSLAFAKGSLTTTMRYMPAHIALQCDAKEVALNSLSFLFPQLTLSGTLDGTMQLYGSPSQPLGDIHLALHKVAPPFSLPSLSLEASLHGTLIHNALQTSGIINAIGDHPIDFVATLPLAFSLAPPQLSIDATAPLSAHFSLQGEVSSVLQLFMAHTTSITGTILSAIDITGSLAQPLIQGEITIHNGSYESLLSGAVFKNIQAKIKGDERTLQLITLSAVDGGEGSIQATGKLELDPEKHFPFDIALDIQHASLLHLDYARAMATGQLHYKGNIEQEALVGTLSVDKATIRIPEEVPAQMHALDVTYINHMPDNPPPTFHLQKKKTRTPTTLDVALQVPRHLHVAGKNLTSEWKGSIAITGTDSDPLLHGSLEMTKGEYLFNGKKLALQHGLISFAGDPANKTSLHVAAGQEISGIKVEAILKGPIKHPQLTFRSNPPLSQKEILSWLLFNRGATDISTTQSDQLTQSMITLSGGNASNDLLGKIRRSFGIDRIDIGSKNTTETNEVSLRVGKYIARNLFLSINKGINSEKNQVAIEANLSRHIKAEAEVNNDAEGRMILKWQKDY